MAMKDYKLPPLSINDGYRPLEFSWDENTGELAGRDADYVKVLASQGVVSAHPVPHDYALSAEPLKNKTDMAAILGYEYRLPEDLAPFYPQLDAGDPDAPEGLTY